MRNAWRKSSQSADACAEATVLDLTVRGGAVVGMSPVPLRGAKLDDAVSDTVADVVGDGIPTTVHDAWDAFAAQDPKSADGLLLEARQLFRAKKDEEILDEPAARDLAIKAAFGALTDVDRKMPLVSQAELLYNQVLAGRRYLADGGNPVDQLIAALRSVNNVRAFMNPAERQVIDGIESGVIAVTANQAAALRQAGIAAHSVLSLTPQQTQYAGAGQWSSGSSYAPQQAYAPQRVYASSSGGTSSSQQSRVPALSPQMIDARYRRLAPDLSTLLERLDYAGDMRELANGINAHHYLVMDERDAHGRLSNRAMQAYEVGRQRFVDAEMSAILGRSSVVAEGISDNELRNLPREQVFWHPELESYLERSNLGHHFDRNGALEVFREQIGPLRVNFHRERRYDPVVQRSQQRMRNAVIALQQRGYQFQEAELQVYLPRYADRITVTRSRGTGRPVDIRREVIVGNSHTHFVPPNNILLMPRSGVEFPVGFQRSGDVADLGVYDRVAHIAEAGIVHEVAHFLHYQNNPRAMADLLNTALIDDENTEITGEVSAYASENPAEFVAEYVTATRYDMGFDPEVRQALSALNAAFGGPELVPGAVPLRAPSLTAAELTYLRPLVVRELRMRGHDFVPDDGQLQWAQARLRGFAQWAVHDERAGAIAHVFMESLASSTSGTGTSRSVYGPYYPQVRMTDDSDGRRNGFGTVLESERAKQNPDPTTVATLERFAAQWSGSPQDGASIARSTGSTGEAAARVAPLAALDATPRGFEPAPVEAERQQVVPPEPLRPEPLRPVAEHPEGLSYGVNGAPAGVGWTVARWARSWGMSFVPGGPLPFLDAVLAGAGGAVTLSDRPVRDVVRLREELADQVRADTHTPTEDLPWWPAAAEAYRSVTREWMAAGDPDHDLVQLDRTIEAAFETGEARQNIAAVLVDRSSDAASDTGYWDRLADQVLPSVVSHYLGRDLFVVGADGQARAYGPLTGPALDGARPAVVIVEAADGGHARTGWAAAVPRDARRAFDGLSGHQVAWAMGAGLRVLGAPAQGALGVGFLDAVGLVLPPSEHERLVAALGGPAPASGTLDDRWPALAAEQLDVALRVLDRDGSVRDHGDPASGHVTLARTAGNAWVALAPARQPQDAAAATRVADVAGAPAFRALEDLVEDDRLVAVPPVAEQDPASTVLSPDQQRWALSHGRQVTVPPGDDVFGAILQALDGGLPVGQRIVTDAQDLRAAVVEAGRRERDDDLDLWLTIYSVYADHYARRTRAPGQAADDLRLAADIDARVDTGAAMDDILASITDPASWPELADSVAPFLLQLVGVAVRVVRPDGSLDRYGQGRPAYVASVPDDTTAPRTSGPGAWAALPSQALHFPAMSPLNALMPASQQAPGALDSWLREHQAALGTEAAGPDGFFEAVLDAVGGRLTGGAIDAGSAAELRAALSDHATDSAARTMPSFVRAVYTFESEARIVEHHFDGSPALADARALHDQIAEHVRSGDAWHYIAQALAGPGDWDALTTALAPALLAERAGVDLVVVGFEGQVARYGTEGGPRVVLARGAGQVPAWAPVRPSARTSEEAAAQAPTTVRTLDTLFTDVVERVDTTATPSGQVGEAVLDNASDEGSLYRAILDAVGGGLLVDRDTYVDTPEWLQIALTGLVVNHPEALGQEARDAIRRETGRSGTESILEALWTPEARDADTVGAYLVGPYLGIALHAVTPEGRTVYGDHGRRVVLAPAERQDGTSGWAPLADRSHDGPVTARASRSQLPALPVHRAHVLSLNQRSRQTAKNPQGFQHVAPGKKVSEAGWHKSSYSGDYCVTVSVVAFSTTGA